VGKLARSVANAYGLHGAAVLDDLNSVGYIRAIELSKLFRATSPLAWHDPDRAFWGWAYREVLTCLQREAARILAGGTIRSPRRTAGAPMIFARPLSDFTSEEGEELVLAAPDPDDRPKQPVKPADYRRFLATAERLGKLYADFLALASKLTDGDCPPTAEPADDGGFVLRWEDNRGPQELTIRPDGTLEHDAGD
jgi:hypothetical protein